mmetsp:Transcript_8391/g.13278  ORF Transcript_8391/g.13278 Transcript_8391/m.13278 type:complete len:83 (+) Transcript_8391:407-655(+)
MLTVPKDVASHQQLSHYNSHPISDDSTEYPKADRQARFWRYRSKELSNGRTQENKPRWNDVGAQQHSSKRQREDLKPSNDPR